MPTSRTASPASTAAYKGALLREFKRHIGEEVAEQETGLEIRVFGAGCPTCDRLTQDVYAVLAELKLDVDFEHVKDIAEIGKLGPVSPPVLMINGKIVSAGRVPRRSKIAGWLREVSE